MCVGWMADSVGDWDDFDWGWKDDDKELAEMEADTELQCWLQECLVSMSPTADLIAIANAARIAHFTREYAAMLRVFLSKVGLIPLLVVFL